VESADILHCGRKTAFVSDKVYGYDHYKRIEYLNCKEKWNNSA
jgi:hypothetical protein